MWDYREGIRKHREREEWVPNAEGRFFSLLNRMQGKPDAAPAGEPPKAAFDLPKILALKQRLIDLSSMEPHPRGYAFEVWLRDAFNFYGLEAREPFRNKGEQIDGSFVLQGETYLLEAKWESAKTSAADLHAFQGKLEQKAAWARGLFVSNSGFTEDGLIAFGRGKRVVCMDGLDLFDALDRELPLNLAIDRKVRRAAETGLPFERIAQPLLALTWRPSLCDCGFAKLGAGMLAFAVERPARSSTTGCAPACAGFCCLTATHCVADRCFWRPTGVCRRK